MNVVSSQFARVKNAVRRLSSSHRTDADRAEQAAPQRRYSETRQLLASMGAKGESLESLRPTAFSVNLGVAPCNHSCIFCPQSVHKPKKARWLDLDLLRKVLEEMPEEGIQIGLSSYSETITAPNVVPAVKLMKEIRPKLRIAMASNGTVIRMSVVEQLIDAGLDHYSFSFDGATPEDYRKLMQVDHYDKAKRSLEQLIELRNHKKSPMQVTTHIMAFEGRRDDFEKFKQEWEGKVDFVQWRTVANWGGDVWGLEERMRERGFVPEHKTPAKRYPCFSIMHHFKLNWNGNYYPCVAAVPDYEAELERHCVPALGHASEMSWEDAWKALGAMRSAHVEGRWNDHEPCRSCNVWSVYDDVWEREATPDGGWRFRFPDIDA